MKNRFLGIICLLYSLIIGFVHRYNILGNFLAPSMHIYIYFSGITLLIIGLIICFSEKTHYKFKISDLLLLLPLIILIFAGDGRLTLNYSNNKVVKMEKKGTNKPIKKKYKEIDITKEIYDFKEPFFDVNDTNYLDLANNITFITKPDKFIGKTIRVRGFSTTNNENLPKGYFMLGKYGVSCCAADAGIVGFIAKYDKYKIKNNSWYEIEGVLEVGYDKAGYTIMTIKIVNLKEIDSKSEEQYVYPCYNYGDDNCEKIMNYGFDS